ncbi:reverse transcriptase domain-containing protein [Tanacetum coccineum]
MGLGIPIYPKKKIEEGMVNLQPMEEEIRGAKARDVGTETREEPTEPVLQTQKTPSPSPAYIKENIDVLKTMIKEHDQQAKTKATSRRLAYANSDEEASARQTRFVGKIQRTPSKNKEPSHLRRSKRLEHRSKTKEKTRRERPKSKGKRSGHQEIISDFEYEEILEDIYEDLNSPYKRPKPTPFTQRITRFKYHWSAKLPRNIRVYEGNKDPMDHLGIFLATAEQEEWSMPVWCKIFCQTLGGAARNWFDDLDPKSVENFEELSQKFLEEFSQQKRYAKDPTKIRGIKRRQNEGLQAFMDRFKTESSHIKGVPPAWAFIRGEVAACSTKMVCPLLWDKGNVRPAWSRGPEKIRNRGGLRETQRNMRIYTPYPKKDTFTPLIKTPKEILAMESVSFPEPPPLIGTPEKQNLNKFCDYHGDRGHNTNDCY